MRLELRFQIEKMDGAGNTFFVLDERPPRVESLERYDRLARVLCAGSAELGRADGMLVIRDAPGFAAEMRVFNADGSEAEMCGNGVRCVARYLSERGAGDSFVVKTPAGPIVVEILTRDPEFQVRVDVGAVTFPNAFAAERLISSGVQWTFHTVSLGNPHAVLFVDDPDAVDLSELGRAFAADERFPNGTNVHVVKIVDDRTIVVRHFERGVGLTQACGTGAVAAAAAAQRRFGLHAPVTVRVPGGTLVVACAPGENARLTGPAQSLFVRTFAL